MPNTIALSETRLGPYELRGELGRGAMARVWRAFDPNLEREVAIKEPLFDASLPQSTLDEMGRRFVAEGRAAARLNHPGIVTIHAADVYDGRPAIVMELIDGVTLSSLLKGGKLEPVDALSVLDQLLDAVGYAHKQGIVHRDIKPDNIFVTSDNRVKLADFGIAYVDDAAATRATMVGTVLGTPGYMSPEQAVGRLVDARSDLFSVGTVAYEMLTGSNPFGLGDATTLLYRIVHEPVPELPKATTAGLPADLRPAIIAALAKDPVDRPQSAASFKAMLHGWQEAPTARLTAPKSTRTEVVLKTGSGLPTWVPVVVAVVAVAVLVGVFAMANSGSGGGMAGSTAPEASSASQSKEVTQQLAPTAQSALEVVTLGVYDGHVAVFKSTQEDPYRVTEIPIDVLESETIALLGAGVECESLDDALARVDTFIEESKKLEEEEANKAKAEIEETSGAGAKTESHEDAVAKADSKLGRFYGIWIGASQDEQEAKAIRDSARNAGFSSYVYLTTDWENLNSDPWYVITTGPYSSEEEANAELAAVQGAGWPDAYVKYSGERKASQYNSFS